MKTQSNKTETNRQKRKFSSFFRSLVIELDKDLYGPDNHLVEVSHHHRQAIDESYFSLVQLYTVYIPI